MNTPKLTLTLLFIITLQLTGCSSTGVVPIGGDTYMISRNGSALSAGSNLKAALYKEANEWCRQQGLVLVPVSENATDGTPGENLGSAEIKFRAVKPGQEPINRRDRLGMSAEDYQQLAAQYESEGRREMAKLARERAAALR